MIRLCLLAFALAACASDVPPAPGAPAEPARSPAAGAAARADPGGGAPYRFDRPTARFELPRALRETSALTVLDEAHVAMVEDESGILFVVSVATGEVTRRVPFGPPGDYEGVEKAGDRLFVLRADGALLELSGWQGQRATARTFATGLGAGACDAEGLGYDAQRDRLLIACKEEADGKSAVHAFDLRANALAPRPVFALGRDEVPGKGKVRPSALAVHPLTGDVVVLASKRESLVLVGPDGSMRGAWSIEEAGFEQPEGLTFLPSGDVLISSEAGGGEPAVLTRFAYAPAGTSP
jgi:uncharacterized protein YjiK